MKLKQGVKLTHFCPQILLAAIIVEDIMRGFVPYSYHATITSCDDGKHGPTTLHGTGRAIDIRTKDIPVGIDKHKLTATIKEHLGVDFDVLFEYENEVNEHLHIEYDPKQVTA